MMYGNMTQPTFDMRGLSAVYSKLGWCEEAMVKMMQAQDMFQVGSWQVVASRKHDTEQSENVKMCHSRGLHLTVLVSVSYFLEGVVRLYCWDLEMCSITVVPE